MSATHGKTGSRLDRRFSAAVNETITGTKEELNTVAKEEEKKSGRPSGEKTFKISLALPVIEREDIDTAADLLYKGNRTAYIQALIKKDLAENGSKYQEFKKMREQMNA